MIGFSKKTNLGFEEAEKKVRQELEKEGFGVLTEIDVSAVLKKKLDKDYGKYKILGACNPPFAFKALEAEKEIGLLLPCNVIIYENNGVNVSAVNPMEAMEMIENEGLKGIAEEVSEKLKMVIERV
ncbi:hypothetical protein COU62_00900 [Candidatus Pacearchaeota archaeon CG10_big_fil_rev_8_21_14_0_10_35_219]|nr:DUF302 domain-containing protein [Candidatus Pacearchaeota archaeon]OIO42998.1 MAG: hypothetical protein AUJ63_01070 [Candidatus Pacearchaeota archaeon CG1_02_35_32]PIO08123.1 MAG: hypothetical protein COU62_00900 [Candidatus Pacearchaeota archaeon CG10_big_fil_rev_8_21_14_0_10_35_219]PIY81057.1 MAG: hypothetical protein COY79_04610 [Candidatus Pacearchaeota archaeon CG_4_10_14_0_8_um_filter_35_169]PIZ79929.1 MAG: hypothetical protein COY00_02920 [Candidatus Pacearchaeota archaeon CG_4_10_14